jgi:hypothetical protein
VLGLALASTVAGIARARRFELPLPGLARHNAVQVVLHREGGLVEPGDDDARRLTSGVVERSGLDWLEVPGFAGDDGEWAALVGCVQDEYAGLAVEVSDTPPARGDYIVVVVGGSPAAFGFDDQVGGIAPWNGRVIDDAVVFAFQNPDTTGRELCERTSHEIGHALGLDHTRDCGDLMSYESCGEKHFQEAPVACGEWEERECGSGRSTQSSADELARRVGRPRDGDDDELETELIALGTGNWFRR